MSQLNSIAEQYSAGLDGRVLRLQLDYQYLTVSEHRALMLCIFRELYELLGEFYVSWTSETGAFPSRSRKPEQMLAGLEQVLREEPGEFHYEARAFVPSSVVYDSKSRQAYDKLGESYRHQSIFFRQREMADYLEYWQGHFHPGMSLEELRLAVIQLFREEEHHPRTHWMDQDAIADVFSVEHQDKPGHYHGTVNLHMALACLGKEVAAFSRKLAKITEAAAELSPNLSGVISLSPINFLGDAGVHSWYAPSHRTAAPSFLQEHPYWGKTQNYRGWYCIGCEWYQLLSLQQQKLLPDLMGLQERYPSLLISPRGHGAVSVEVKRPILELRTEDLFPVKKLLYPALVPGDIHFFRSVLTGEIWIPPWLPRARWEQLPLYPEEVQVVEQGLTYHANFTTVEEGGIRIRHLDACPDET